ncbi:MAG TPA: hypothetical protein VJ928_01215 [Marivita sp.]|nr:hypothetical protein [Marivita sp.]
MTYRICLAFVLVTSPAFADAPVVEAVEISGSRVSVTLSHADTGWDHYADGWRIETEDGTVVGTRELLHPHVNEQPFTRSLTVSELPEEPIFIRARDNVDGWAPTVFYVQR